MSSLFIDGLSPQEVLTIEHRMRDQGFSRLRFLGTGESLVQRVRADADTLRELDVTPDQIADRLDAIVREADRLRELRMQTPEYQQQVAELALRALEVDDLSQLVREEREAGAVIVSARFSVTMDVYRGPQFCPFEYHCDGTSISSCGQASRDIEIRNIRRNTSIWFSELLIHMIREHQFFEGEGLPYRLDPGVAVKTLEANALPAPAAGLNRRSIGTPRSKSPE